MRSAAHGILLTVIIAGSLVVARPGQAQEARTDAPTPSPLPAPTAGIPNAGHVVDLMMRAWQAAGSDHFRLQQTTTIMSGKNVTTYAGPQTGAVTFGSNPPVFHTGGRTRVTKKTSHGTKATRSWEVQLYAQNFLAIRLGSKAWSCDHFFGYTALPGSPVWDETSPYGVGARTLGVVTVNGVPAWHVRSFLVTWGGGKASRSVTVRDYYASVANYLPVEIRITSQTFRKHRRVRSRTVLTFSGFGEPTHVTLPPACTGK